MDGINALIAGVGRPQAKAFDYAEANRNALLQRGGELDLQNAQRDAELRPFKDEMAAISYLSDIAPMVEYENYPSIRDRLTRMGISQGILPDPNMFEQEGQKYGVTGKDYFNVWKKSAITGLQQQALRVKTAGEGYKPRTKEEAMELAGARSGTRKIGDKQTYQKGDTEVTERWNGTEWEVIGSGPKWNPKGEEFEIATDKEGNVTVRKGPAGSGAAGAMTKPTQTKVEGKLFDSENSLSRLQRIEEAFKPEFLTWRTKIGQEIISGKAKLGMEVSEEDKQKRIEFVTFKRRAISNLNQYLNELSGAAITEQEAKRLMEAMPSVNTDDPIEFEAKMRDVIEEAKLAHARYKYLLANGWSDEQIVGTIKKEKVQSIGSFKMQIQARGKEISEELKKAGTYEGDIPGIIKERLRQEFKL